jgi:hypothetical protein
MLKGVLIFALGHPYYGKLAYNLAVSMKAIGPVQIAVVHTDRSLSHLGDTQQAIFDIKIPLPDNIPTGCGAKLWGYKLSPFDVTLQLDADMLWLPGKTPEALFKELEDVEFTSITEGYWTDTQQDANPQYFFWADPVEIAEVYKVQKVYQWRTEVLWWKRTETVQQLFDLAQDVYLESGLKSEAVYATGTADELGLNVSAAVHDVHPHIYKWTPAYWHLLHKGTYPEFAALYANYYLASFGSNIASGTAKKFYDRIMKSACNKMGLQYLFPLQSKREILPERKKM